MNPDESYMTFPGFETDGFTKIATHNVIEQSYWNVDFASITGPNGTVSTKGFKAAIDSGTSLIVGPKDLVDQVTAGITVDTDCSKNAGLPNITFTFDQTDYVLEPADYIVPVTEFGHTQCMMGIQGAKLPDGFSYFIVGDVFMRRYPTYFNKNDNTVTFYEPSK